MGRTTLEKYKQLVEEQGRVLLEAIQYAALGDLDVEIKVPEGVKVLSDLAVGIEGMLDGFRATLAEQVQARAEVEEARRQLEVALEEVLSVQRRYLRQEWEEHVTAEESRRGYFCFPDAEGPTTDTWLPGMTAAVQRVETVVEEEGAEGSTLAVPIHLYGEVMGALGFSGSKAESWKEDEIAAVEAVVEQVALALESQRLFDEAQQATFLLSKRIRELDCLNDIGRRIDENPPILELLQWVADRIPRAMQYPDLCVAAIEFEGQVYGSSEAVKLPCQMVRSLHIGDELVGRLYVSSSKERDFLDEESALLGDIVRRLSSYIEQRRLAAALGSERSTLEAVVRNIPLGVFVAEAPTGKPLMANDLAREILGESIISEGGEETLAQVKIYRYGTDELYPTEEMPHVRGMSGQVVTVNDMEVRRPDGSRMLLEVSGVPIGDASGKVVGSVATFQDITAKKQNEAEQKRLLINIQSRALQLQTAAEVSRAATLILDINELLNTSVNLIRDRFGHYYVGLFLVDAIRKFAVLRAGTGEAGRAMLEEGHKLEIGGESMVGWCIQHRQARIALDVGEDAMRFRNPHLPLTRSEMALPLVSRGQVLGALTVQSTEEAAFSDDDIVVLQTMTDQVANALINARQFELIKRARSETDKRVREINCLNDIGYKMAESLLMEELLPWIATRIPLAMQYSVDCVVAIEYQGRVYGNAEARDLSQQIVQSLHMGNGASGRIYVAYKREHGFLDEESALLGDIARRLSNYIENQRLLRETEMRARREQTLRQITARVRGSTDPAAIMRTAVRELGTALGRSTFVRLGSAEHLSRASVPPVGGGDDQGVAQEGGE